MDTSTRSTTHNNTEPKTDDNCCKLVSDEVRIVVEIMFYIFVTGVFGIFGIVANVLNVIVFLKQGLQDSSNITLFCLSICDWFISFFTLLSSICFAMEKLLPGSPIDVGSVFLVTVANPLLYFSKMSMVTTMYLCFERCLCVVIPLTVKLVITRGRSVVVLSVLYLHLTIFHAVYFALMSSLTWKNDPKFNRTRLLLEDHPLRPLVHQLNQAINGSFLTTGSVLIVLVSSVVMVIGVLKATRRRQELVSSNTESSEKAGQSGMSRRDARLVQMVIYIAFLFLISYIPMLGIELVEAFIEPGLDMFGKYHNLNQVLWALVTALCAMSAAGNILIYYFISERYRTIFLAIMNKGENTQ